uniref:ATPase subunit 8 n=1 Tax=Antedon mediterranea TaxID=105859 RepID=B2FDN5_ANTME|nr:ATP synthase F0 subunit 8 [Antedon mediterranea]CAL50590.1 ATPase subunit 8 [Antedon mediterranea]
MPQLDFFWWGLNFFFCWFFFSILFIYINNLKLDFLNQSNNISFIFNLNLNSWLW